MSEGNIVRIRVLPNGAVVELLSDGSTRPYISKRSDFVRLAAMTDEEIEANALSDPDNPPLTEEQLARARRLPNPQRIRQGLHLTQEQFAERFEAPLGTLRDWERGSRQPDTAARTLLRVIEHNPEAVLAALAPAHENAKLIKPGRTGLSPTRLASPRRRRVSPLLRDARGNEAGTRLRCIGVDVYRTRFG